MGISYWIDKGGPLAVILLILNIIGWSILIWKFFEISIFFRQMNNHVKVIKMSLSDYSFDEMGFTGTEKLNYVLSYYMDPFYKGLSTIKIIAIICPLIGLLGTVLGILNSFRTIGENGLSDPSLFASGISLALITTVGGLIVSIPHFIGYNYISAILKSGERILEKKLLKRAE